MSLSVRRFFIIAVLLLVGLAACQRSISLTPTIAAQPNLTIYPLLTPQSGAATATAPAWLVSPTPGPSPTAAPTQPSVAARPALLAVFDIEAPDVLNLRADPGVSAEIIRFLNAGERDLPGTGGQQVVDGREWLEIQLEDGVGWVASTYVVEQVTALDFCADSRLNGLIDSFAQAIKNQDGAALSRLISPRHGLRIHLSQSAPPVIIGPQDALNIFTSQTVTDWGLNPGSGEIIGGTFAELVQPRLLDVLDGQYQRVCSSLQQGLAVGSTAELIAWPAAYVDVNYIALYRAAPPSRELDWRTWAVGVDYVAGAPYLLALVQYFYTP